MKRIAVVVGGILLVVATVGVGRALTSSGSGIVRSDVLRFALQLANEDTGDVRPRGDSPGDTFFSQGELLNFDLTKRFGRYASACVLENLETRLNHCMSTVSLSQGKVELSGRVLFTDTLQA